jgi:hypothetical protein
MNEEELRLLARRETLRKMAVTGALGASGILGLVRDALADSKQVAQGIRHVKGPVTIDGQIAVVGQPIRSGQIISTGPGGETSFVVGADAFLQRENTKFTFEDTASVAVLRYISGKILSVFGKGHKQLITSTATIGIRGTGCYIETEEINTYFCLCYGEAEVVPHSDPARKEILNTKHHEAPTNIGTQPGSSIMTPAKPINHTDSELVLLENLVNRWPPFYGLTTPGGSY